VDKFQFFCDYLKNAVEIWHYVCTGLRRLGALQHRWDDFLKTIPPEGAKFFHRGLFKGSLIFDFWS